MPKIKTHKGAAKRITQTKRGKLLRRRAFGNHFLAKKDSARKRANNRESELKGASKKTLRQMLGGN